jgi:hypothetical protein
MAGDLVDDGGRGVPARAAPTIHDARQAGAGRD